MLSLEDELFEFVTFASRGFAAVRTRNEQADGPALRPDGPRLWAGRSARAQNILGFRVLCYGR
jgi:hypothetical protein